MDSALVALPVPDDWALVEVLWWAAFRLYPVDINDPDHEYEYEGNRCMMDPEVLLKDLGVDASFEFIENALFGCHCDDDGIWHDDDDSKTTRARFDEMTSGLLDAKKAEIFLLLRQGDLPAKGVPFYSIPDNVRPGGWIDDANWVEEDFLGYENTSAIPANDWRQAGIRWDENFAATPSGCFGAVRLSAEEVVMHFPEPKPEPAKVEKRNGTMFLADDSAEMRPRGRPLRYPWHAFLQHVCVIAATRGLPTKMGALEKEMLEWWQSTWGKDPTDSTVRRYLSPIYAELQKIGHWEAET